MPGEVAVPGGDGWKTLGIRGSEKSLYGKFFEKLVLVGVLHLLGFSLAEKEHVAPRSFCLSSRNERSESDATLIYNLGEGVRFDIGFIGPGNSEISLDKVSRFEREAEFGNQKVYMRTIVIVDRIGAKSRIKRLAANIDGVVLQMSMAYWPQGLGAELADVFEEYESPLDGLSGAELKGAIREGCAGAPYEQALAFVTQPATEEVLAQEEE